MAVSRFSDSTIISGFPKYQSFTRQYTGETVSGGNGYSNMSTYWSVITAGNTSLTTGGTPQWSCSNQGSYYGGSQSIGAGGTASFRYTLNGGLALPAGTYSYSGTQYLEWSSGGVSHDGMYLWAVTSTEKKTIVNSVSPPDSLNTNLTKTGTFTLSSPDTVYLNWEIYDGSSATAMGGRVYGFTVAKIA